MCDIATRTDQEGVLRPDSMVNEIGVSIERWVEFEEMKARAVTTNYHGLNIGWLTILPEVRWNHQPR